jgi:hypothetical protein
MTVSLTNGEGGLKQSLLSVAGPRVFPRPYGLSDALRWPMPMMSSQDGRLWNVAEIAQC